MINITDFIYFGDYNNKMQELANMSPEQWNFSGQTGNNILKIIMQD